MAATLRKSCSTNLPIAYAWDTKRSFYYSIQPIVVSESAPSSPHVTTPQDTEVNLASSYFPPADFVHSQIPASAPVYPGAEPQASHVPVSFQYDLDDFNSSQVEDIFSLRYDPSCHFLPPSSSTQARLNMEHTVEPYQQWLPVDSNTRNLIPQPSLSYVSNASSTFPGISDNGITYAEIAGFSHLTMTTSESANDGATTLVPFPTYDANSYYMWFPMIGDRLSYHILMTY